MSDDHLLLRKLQEQEGQAQGVLEQELHNQRQQLELHIAHLNETHQEVMTASHEWILQWIKTGKEEHSWLEKCEVTED